MAFRAEAEDCPATAAAEAGGVQSGMRGDNWLEKAAVAYLEDMPVAEMLTHWRCSGCMPSGEAEVESGRSHHPAVAERAAAIHFPLVRSRTPVWSLSELLGCHLIFCSV